MKCIYMLLVTLLMALSSYEVCILTSLSDICTQTNLYMWHLRGIFVSGTFLARMCKVAVAGGCILVDMGKYVGFMCPFNTVAHICNMAAIFVLCE